MSIRKQLDLILCKPVVHETVVWNPPASDLEIDDFERRIGYSLPGELQELWRFANGEATDSEGLLGGYRLAALKESAGIVEDLLQMKSDGDLRTKFSPEFLGPCDAFEKGWIPLGVIVPRELLICDIRSKESAIFFLWSIELGPYELLAKSVNQFLKFLHDEVVGDQFIEPL